MNKKIVYVVVGIIVLVGVFYGGVVYGKGQKTTGATGTAFNMGTRGTRGNGFGGVTVGQIISKDATSITVGLATGGSKIIFLDNSTPITKQVSGNMGDLVVGTQVYVTGATNGDGSINAQSIQIRPKMALINTSLPNVVQ